jgi:hypothetical protein
VGRVFLVMFGLTSSGYSLLMFDYSIPGWAEFTQACLSLSAVARALSCLIESSRGGQSLPMFG